VFSNSNFNFSSTFEFPSDTYFEEESDECVQIKMTVFFNQNGETSNSRIE
jgi:hypothetical protein